MQLSLPAALAYSPGEHCEQLKLPVVFTYSRANNRGIEDCQSRFGISHRGKHYM